VIESTTNFHLLVLLTGAVVVLTLLVKAGLERISVPPLVGFFVLGFFLRLANSNWGLLAGESLEIFHFLAQLGLVTLLFRIGLESDIGGLLKQLRSASLIWIVNVLISGVVGFLTAFYLLGLSWITSLIIGTAFTATSVGISVAVWQDGDALDSPNGELLLDVAEMDDISAVVLLALLFALLPTLREGADASILPVLGKSTGLFLLKLAAFTAACYFFSRFLEGPITFFFKQLEPAPSPMLAVAGIGIIIAAVAGLIGFSLAIGAFFAGLVFSRDPQAVKMEASFLPIYELFSPFFFIGVGLKIGPDSLVTALGIGCILAVAAIGAKLIGAGVPVSLMRGMTGGLLIGTSMVPRAEITMVIMQKGLTLGDWAVPQKVFGAMVVVSAATCIISPVAIRAMLRKWPQERSS
jgi:Kef-type K+ transport system membrane component KefB